MDRMALSESMCWVEKKDSARDWEVMGDEGPPKAAELAMSVKARSAATTISGGLAYGEICTRTAGRAREACIGAKKAGPPIVVVSEMHIFRAHGATDRERS